ncbi:hypothetical protein CPB84DRAFT_1747441 [Gymnopilus junonius]|uniref:Uncharacterized protein n=1 Tax=Gymnopilus junonius TaxID=109634 RepID=A0A9P5TMZ1_GYMJU|nr:hypothetical protein CPB84DRAFT_1747441 [Gymnopilus junonius]
MTYTNSHESILWTSKSEIFADSAPLLRKYDCPEFAVSLNASWIYQLQDISFSDHFNQVSLLQILQTLKHMKFLQSLQIHFASHFGQLEILTQHPTSSLPYILLPRLQYINLYSTASQSTCLQLLGCITPAPGCTVEFMALHSVDSMDELDESRKIFARLLRNYFILNPPKSFALSTHSYFFKLHDLAPTSAPFYSLFTFAIRYMDWLSSHAEGLFLKSLMESQFVTSLTLLKLTLPDDERHYGSDFLRFTQSLSSLTTLQTGYMTVLYRLCQMPEVQPVPFPALKTLKINELGEVIPDTIHRFIAWRTTCGLPLALLDLTDRQVGVFREEDLRSLEAFVKLKVIWQGPNSIEEYVCGSGSPNRLYFPMRQSPEEITGTEW